MHACTPLLILLALLAHLALYGHANAVLVAAAVPAASSECIAPNGEADACVLVACDAGYEPMPGADGTLHVGAGARCRRCVAGTFKSADTLAACRPCVNAPRAATYLRNGETGPECVYECAPGRAGAACVSVYLLLSAAALTLAVPALARFWIAINRLGRVRHKSH